MTEVQELQARIPHKVRGIVKGIVGVVWGCEMRQMSNQTHVEVSPNVRKSASERVREVDV